MLKPRANNFIRNEKIKKIIIKIIKKSRKKNKSTWITLTNPATHDMGVTIEGQLKSSRVAINILRFNFARLSKDTHGHG